MILAHKSDLTFYTLLQMLDHPRNDLFIHMDIKNNQFDPETVYSAVKHSHAYLTERMSIACQKLCKVWRNLDVPFGKGEAWASITKDMADYILDNRKDVEKWFKYTFCGDEEWFQTVADASGLSKNLYRPKTEKQTCDIMRLIDWNRGEPYVFRSEDWEELRDSDMLWARKFDARVDSQIIEKLRDYYTKAE